MALLTTTYQWLLTVHILAAVVWVGGAFTLQVMAIRVVRDPDPARLAAFARDTEVVGMRVFLPASLVLLLFGFWLVHEGNWSLSEGWLTFGLIVIGISIVTGAGFLGPESGRIARVIEAEGPASSRCAAADQPHLPDLADRAGAAAVDGRGDDRQAGYVARIAISSWQAARGLDRVCGDPPGVRGVTGPKGANDVPCHADLTLGGAGDDRRCMRQLLQLVELRRRRQHTPAVISSATTSTSSSSGNLGGGSSYCGQGKDEIKQLQSKLASVNSITSASDRLKQYMSTLKSAYANAESNAPSQIQPDLAEITTFINKLDAAFAAHNYNLQQSLATAEPLYLANAAKLKLAGTHLKAWAAANCGG